MEITLFDLVTLTYTADAEGKNKSTVSKSSKCALIQICEFNSSWAFQRWFWIENLTILAKSQWFMHCRQTKFKIAFSLEVRKRGMCELRELHSHFQIKCSWLCSFASSKYLFLSSPFYRLLPLYCSQTGHWCNWEWCDRQTILCNGRCVVKILATDEPSSCCGNRNNTTVNLKRQQAGFFFTKCNLMLK